MTEQIKHIAVIGAGYMGGGIAQVFGMAGLDVVIMDADPDITARHLDRLRQEAEDFENRGLLEPGSAELVRKNLGAANSLAEAVEDAGGGSVPDRPSSRPVQKPVVQDQGRALPPALVAEGLPQAGQQPDRLGHPRSQATAGHFDDQYPGQQLLQHLFSAAPSR